MRPSSGARARRATQSPSSAAGRSSVSWGATSDSLSGSRSKVMRSFASYFVCVVLFWTAAIVKAPADGLITYFSEEIPQEIPKPKVPSSEDNVVLAKVRVLNPPTDIRNVDQSGRPSSNVPREPCAVWLRVLEVIRGKRPELASIYVTFGSDLSYAEGPTTPASARERLFRSDVRRQVRVSSYRCSHRSRQVYRVAARNWYVRARASQVAFEIAGFFGLYRKKKLS